MSEKSYVSLEHHLCPVCGTKHATNSILFDRRLRKLMEKETVTGWSMCPSCQSRFDEGFVALVEITNGDGRNVKMENANRTGNVAHLRRSVAKKIFNVSFPDELPVVFVDQEVIGKIQSMVMGENS